MINSRIGLCATAVAGYVLIDQTVHVWGHDPGRRPIIGFLLALGAFLLAAVYLIVVTVQSRAEERLELQIALAHQAEGKQADAILASVPSAGVHLLSPRIPRVE